jgi:hypothetical protein
VQGRFSQLRAARQLVLAIAPGNLLDHDATIPAVNASHAVEQENQKTPQGDELEAALGEMIVSGAGRWHPEQTAADPSRGRTSTSMLLLSAPKRAWW